MDIDEVLAAAARIATEWLTSLDSRPIAPAASLAEMRERLGGDLPEGPLPPLQVVEQLAEAAGPGLLASPSGRFFGFVIGGGVPAAVAADWLTAAWDQNAGLYAAGPAASVVEEVAGGWLRDLLGLAAGSSFAFVTGCQAAHVTCLAAARHEVLRRAGWNVEEDGLAGAPRVRVVAGANRHVTVDRALRLLGFGTASVTTDLAALVPGEPAIVCAQAGDVNTGAFDDLAAIAGRCAEAGAWMHVDGAFGLWTRAAPALRHLAAGAERADSWAFDAHKWLNVPYDSGIAFCRHPEAHRAAIGVTASYLVQGGAGAPRDQLDWTPEFSRRARGFAVYAALRSLGRSGVADLVERCCAHARRFAEGVAALPGCEVLDEVVLNQVLFRFADDAATDRVLRAVVDGGEAWMSGTTVHGRRAIRLSVINWRTTEHDVDRALAAFRAAV
ncbi:pyridoxal-dependent decarboxylase [Actinoplanes sp. NPDC023714]|uniref:pyridoxal phosphate-dependent decarboxylase family protein n=1 Tax=Actinoplanes sp. NPDC023714 TaxID=3154322 RepID=UPI00340C06AB